MPDRSLVVTHIQSSAGHAKGAVLLALGSLKDHTYGVVSGQLMRSIVIASFLLMWPTLAAAVSLGKIDVGSHLGETFFAEVPLQLEEDESISNVFVELASPADYRILEIFREPGLNVIRVDILNDSRGQRVELSSDSSLSVPYFSLVLKLRYGRATHFKKYPIVLDLPKTQTKVAQPLAETLPWKKPAEDVQVISKSSPVVEELIVKPELKAGADKFTPFDGWARTSRYGPMVYGDTVSVVARRLQVDQRYTLAQVMVALYEKNRDKFDQDNINLIEKGAFLEVPEASEVEAFSPMQAKKILREHDQRWRKLREKPEYEMIADAQKFRYSKRIRMGKEATGVAKESVPVLADKKQVEVEPKALPPKTEPESTSPEKTTEVALLNQKNAELEQRLADAEKKLREISARIIRPSENDRFSAIEKKLSALQGQLSTAITQGVSTPVGSNGLTYPLAASIILLLIVILYLLRRQKAYIASINKMSSDSQDGKERKKESPEAEEAILERESVSEVGAKEIPATAIETENSETINIPDEPDSGEKNIDPNMDYLGEAEVYLRYGMEGEAIENIRLAILQRPDNVEAHRKLINILANQDSEAFNLALVTARESLSGELLERFEAEVSHLISGEDKPSGSKVSEAEVEVDADGADADAGSPEFNRTESESISSGEEPFIEPAEIEPSIGEDKKGVIESYDELMKKEGEQSSDSGLSDDSFAFELDMDMETSEEDPDATTELLNASEEVGPESASEDVPAESLMDLGPEPLLIDTARSFLAAGDLDEAEKSFKQALKGKQRCLALLGLAEIAQRKGDAEFSQSLLAKAEPLLDKASQAWFKQLKNTDQ